MNICVQYQSLRCKAPTPEKFENAAYRHVPVTQNRHEIGAYKKKRSSNGKIEKRRLLSYHHDKHVIFLSEVFLKHRSKTSNNQGYI